MSIEDLRAELTAPRPLYPTTVEPYVPKTPDAPPVPIAPLTAAEWHAELDRRMTALAERVERARDVNVSLMQRTVHVVDARTAMELVEEWLATDEPGGAP